LLTPLCFEIKYKGVKQKESKKYEKAGPSGYYALTSSRLQESTLEWVREQVKKER
tara:strand:+ start:1054 stop:1218 length:165 start_codon:yes stop_codon:yes gene_type:complete